MEITDQDISDFIKSRGIFTYRDLERSKYYINGRLIESALIRMYSLKIFDLPEVCYNSHIPEGITDDVKDYLTKMFITNIWETSKYDQIGKRIAIIMRREKKLDLLLNGNN